MDRNDIWKQIDRILHSGRFADKDQLKKLLEILFNNMETQATLKPDRVIRELWPEEIKTKQSSDVATEMNRLRREMKAYYETEGLIDPILISFPNRTAPSPNGAREKRWIVAETRSFAETPPTSPTPRVASIPPVTPPPADIPVQRQSSATRAKYRKGFIVLAVIVVGLAAYISIRTMTADDRPQSGRIDNSELVIMNAEGKELWRKTFPGGFWSEYYQDGLATHLVLPGWFGDASLVRRSGRGWPH